MVQIYIVGLVSGMPTPFDFEWLVEYDPSVDYSDPTGRLMNAKIITSPLRSEAKQFENFIKASEYWKLSHGTRNDGKPNRPLTSSTI